MENMSYFTYYYDNTVSTAASPNEQLTFTWYPNNSWNQTIKSDTFERSEISKLKEENDLLRKFAKSLMEMKYGTKE